MERETISQILGLVVLPLTMVVGTAVALYGARDRLRGWHLALALVCAGVSVTILLSARARIEANKGNWGALLDLFIALGAIPVALVSVTAVISILVLRRR